MRFKYLLITSSVILSVGVVLSIAQISLAAQYNPGHPWAQMDCDANACVDITNKRVGIGIAAPEYPLDVAGNVNSAILDIRQNISTMLWTGVRLARQTAEKWFIGINATDDFLRFRRAGGTDDMVIDASGNIGIGTTAPKGKLDVVGGISAGSYAGANAPPTNGMIISGNVGIGNTSPGAALDVNGNILLAGGGSIDTRAAGSLTVGGSTQTGLTLGKSGANTTINGSNIVLGVQADSANEAVRADRSISAGTGLTGGGNLVANVTLSADTSYLQRRVTGSCSSADQSIKVINSDGSVSCETDDKGITSETDPQVNTLSSGKWCTSDGSYVNCTANAPITSETDPQVNTLTSGKWCTSDGTYVNCNNNNPTLTNTNVATASCTSCLTQAATYYCPANYSILGGGCICKSTGSPGETYIRDSHPAGQENWYCLCVNDDKVNNQITAEAWGVCVPK